MQTSPTTNGCDDTTDSHRRVVERVILKMHEQLDRPFSLHEMADVANLSPFHFNRVFRQITGIPPNQFLYALRLEAAKRLLLTTHLRVTDVCFEVGYNSLGTFSTRFTQLVGLSPYQLRHMTDEMTSPVELIPDSLQSFPPATRFVGCISGRITAPHPCSRAIFVGLFRTRIPQGRPVAGVLLTRPGDYNIGPLMDGKYFLFAAALPVATEPLNYLLPNAASLLVGGGQGPIVVMRGQVYGNANIKLRQLRLTDPPILVALPSLLTEQLRV
jgi:AraC-like DNA-binding protein